MFLSNSNKLAANPILVVGVLDNYILLKYRMQHNVKPDM